MVRSCEVWPLLFVTDEVQVIRVVLARADPAADSHGHPSDTIGAIHAPIGTKPALTFVLSCIACLLSYNSPVLRGLST